MTKQNIMKIIITIIVICILFQPQSLASIIANKSPELQAFCLSPIINLENITIRNAFIQLKSRSDIIKQIGQGLMYSLNKELFDYVSDLTWGEKTFLFLLSKKQLVERIQNLGVKVSGVNLSKKKLRSLLEIITDKIILNQLKKFKIEVIELRPLINDDKLPLMLLYEEALLISENFFKYLNGFKSRREKMLFFKYFLCDIGGRSVLLGPRSIYYWQSNDVMKEATSLQLRLSQGAEEVISAIEEKSKKAFVHEGEGFKKIVVGKVKDKSAVGFVSEERRETLTVTDDAIAPFVKLYHTAPKLFDEMVTVFLLHEGGAVGHLMRWPLVSDDDVNKFFNYEKLSEDEFAKAIQEFTLRKWPKNLESEHSVNEWKAASEIIKKAYSDFTSKYEGGEDFISIIEWVEYQAWFGVFQRSGVRGLALFLWFQSEARKLPIDYFNEFIRSFAFLTESERELVLKEVEKIKEEYLHTTKTNVLDFSAHLRSKDMKLLHKADNFKTHPFIRKSHPAFVEMAI
ncbi:MAG: hypothetical protein V1859_03570 [archaeon]